MLPWGLFAPDLASHTVGATDKAEGVIPIGAADYGPMAQASVVSEALPAKPIGALSIRATDGSIYAYACTASHLYRLDTSADPWTWTQDTTTALNLATDSTTSFVPFGDKVIAFNAGMAPKIANIATGGFADLTGSPPRASYGMSFANRVWALRLDGQPNYVQWSGRDSEDFWTVARDGADINPFLDGGPVTGGLRVGKGAFIFQEEAIRYATRVGGVLLFDFTNIVSTMGGVDHASLVEGPGAGYFISENGLYGAQAGGALDPVGADRVNRWFRESQVDLDRLWQVQGAFDPVNEVIFWRYPTVGWASEDYTPRMLGFHYPSRRWVDMPVNLSWLFSAASPGYSLESDRFNDLDNMTDSLDSRIWAGGRPTLAGFDDQFRMVMFTGTPMEAVVETADIQLFPGQRGFVTGARPLIEGTNNWFMQVGTHETATDSLAWGAEETPNSAGEANFLSDGRYHRFRLRIPAGESWSVASGIEQPTATPSGLY